MKTHWDGWDDLRTPSVPPDDFVAVVQWNTRREGLEKQANHAVNPYMYPPNIQQMQPYYEEQQQRHPSFFEKVQPYIKPALLLGGGAAMGGMGMRWWNKHQNMKSNLMHLGNLGHDVEHAKAVAHIHGLGDDARSANRILASELKAHELPRTKADVLHATANPDAAREYINRVRPQETPPAPPTTQAKTASFTKRANLTALERLRPELGALAAGPVGGGLGYLAGKGLAPTSTAIPVITGVAGALLGSHTGGALGRASLDPVKQQELADYEHLLRHGKANLNDTMAEYLPPSSGYEPSNEPPPGYSR